MSCVMELLYFVPSRQLVAQKAVFVGGRSLNAKKPDGIKESTDSSATIEDDDNRSMGPLCSNLL